MTRIVEVAAAVLLRKDGSFLLGRRPEGTFYAGYWEFPGGKVEPGESARDALVRELDEELGIVVECAYPWITREFVYPHAHVRLHFFRVLRWRGELRDIHHSALAWQRSGALEVEPMLPANAPVLRALALPDLYAISAAAQLGVAEQLARLERALAGGLKLVQLREPGLAQRAREDFFRRALRLGHSHGARLLVNDAPPCARALGADGVHLTAARLMTLERRPDLPLVAASCHNAAELAHAAALELDFVVLGAVKPTPSHPGQAGMGWESFGALLRDYPLPAYALGGMSAADLPVALNAGAQGIAALRAAWD